MSEKEPKVNTTPPASETVPAPTGNEKAGLKKPATNVREAAAADEPARAEKAEAFLIAKLGETAISSFSSPEHVAETAEWNPDQKTLKAFLEKYHDSFATFVKDFIDAVQKENTNEKTAEDIISKGEALEKSMTSEEQKILAWITDSKPDPEKSTALNSIIPKEELAENLREALKKNPGLQKQMLSNLQVFQQAIEKRKSAPRYSHDEINKAMKKCQKTAQQEYKDFLDGKITREAYLAKIPDGREKEIVTWALTANPSEIEKKEMLERTLAGKKLTPDEIREKVEKGELNLRDQNVAFALIENEDVQAWEKAGTITSEVAQGLRVDIQARKSIEAAGSKIPDTLEGMGFMALLEKLIKQLTDLFKKLGTELEGQFEKKGGATAEPAAPEVAEPEQNEAPKVPAFEVKSSPVNVTLGEIPQKTKKGFLITKAQDASVLSIADGKITKSEGSIVEVTAADGTVVTYEGLKDGVTRKPPSENSVTASTKLGEINDKGELRVEIKGSDGKSVDAYEKLKSYFPQIP